MSPRSYAASKAYLLSSLGVKLGNEEIINHLRRMRYDALIDGDTVLVSYAPYRTDIMHENDVLEDLAIAYGYNDLAPDIPSLSTTGRLLPITSRLLVARELLVGLGFQEIISFTLSSNEVLFERMNMPRPDDVVEIENPVSASWSVLRNTLVPSLMGFLSRNTHNDYPQNIFEVSETARIDAAAETSVDSSYSMAFAVCSSGANYTAAREALESFMANIGVQFTVRGIEHPSYLPGRVGAIVVKGADVGIIGELHPAVLENWGLENPVAVAEVSLERLLE
jgi:phenylalanyl-tRNA synthetase beta chain